VIAALTTLAPAKINVCLFVGPTRADGRHELVSVMQPLSLADEVRLEPASGGADEVICPGVPGENLAATALARFRAATGWAGPAVRVVIDKRIPVAAGMAGGSADAGAALRLIAAVAGVDNDALLLELAADLGADVTAQVRPRRVLATGAGERIEPLPAPASYGVLVLRSRRQLATAAVYREADRLGLARDAAGLAQRATAVRAALPALPAELAINDLEAAARSLCPELEAALDDARRTGADVAMVSGSGPTVVGLFRDAADADAAARALADRDPRPLACHPAPPDFAAVRPAQ
jgi:4-diphosphocytidyl-2-C-methyl-D-erythritol kinase